jgi:hypothetical protein
MNDERERIDLLQEAQSKSKFTWTVILYCSILLHVIRKLASKSKHVHFLNFKLIFHITDAVHVLADMVITKCFRN